MPHTDVVVGRPVAGDADTRRSFVLHAGAAVLVLLLQLAALIGLQVHATSARDAHVAVVRLAASVDEQVDPASSGGGLTAAGKAAIVGLVRSRLPELNAPADITASIRRADDWLATSTNATSARSIEGLRESLADADDALGHRARRADVEAWVGFALVLTLASFTWIVAFRRFVRDRNLAARRATEQRLLARSERRFRSLVQYASDMVAVLDLDSVVSYVTPSCRSLVGLDPDALVGRRWLELIHPDDVASVVAYLGGVRRSGDPERVRCRLLNATGRTVVTDCMVTDLLHEETVGGLVLTVHDVTDRTELEERLRHQAFHDPLTGLANRDLLVDRLEHALRRREGRSPGIAVLLCDLDDFKTINDGLGHHAGDRVLESVAERLQVALRAGDTAARLGGDEFVVLLEDIESAATAEQIANRILALLGERFSIEGVELSLQASIGLAVAGPEDTRAADVLRNADVAMYRAKQKGKGRLAVFEPQLHRAALHRLELKADLQRALRREELRLHYQPTVELASGRIVGFEALARWQHPVRGLLSPAEFIPLAEETGLIVPLGRWVLMEATRQAAEWQSFSAGVAMSVNIAARQLERGALVDDVVAALDASGLDPRLLILEVTETAVLHQLAEVAPRLRALQDLGVRIAIDDFGTGYSSLSYLSNLPVDVLKIDKSFVDRVSQGGQDAAVAQAIVSMSRSLSLQTVAEGIEQPDQAATLREMTCALGQGFLFSRPLEPVDVPAMLAGRVAATLPEQRTAEGAAAAS